MLSHILSADDIVRHNS